MAGWPGFAAACLAVYMSPHGSLGGGREPLPGRLTGRGPPWAGPRARRRPARARMTVPG